VLTRETILEKAEALFMAQGIQGTSIADVATAAGISKGTLFYHFRSKDELILEIAFANIQRVSDEMLSFIAREEEPLNPRRLAERFIRQVLAATLRNRLHLYLIEESMARNEKLKAALRDKYREWLATMLGALKPFLGEKASILAPILLALTDGLIIQTTLGLDMPPIDEMLKALIPDA